MTRNINVDPSLRPVPPPLNFPENQDIGSTEKVQRFRDIHQGSTNEVGSDRSDFPENIEKFREKHSPTR